VRVEPQLMRYRNCQSIGDAGKPTVTTSLIPTICGYQPAPRFGLTPNRRRASAVTYRPIRADKSIVNTRMAEINNIKTWACANNLTLNLTKTVEIVFVDSKRRRQVQPPSPLATISRVSSLKVLGVTISSQMSVSEHVSTVISSCAKSIYALRTLRSHGMDNEALHMIYTSVIIAKLLYAASAWWGFTTATDRQRLEALIKRGIHSGLCGADVSSLTELVDSADDALFQRILYNPNQLLHSIPVPVRGRACSAP